MVSLTHSEPTAADERHGSPLLATCNPKVSRGATIHWTRELAMPKEILFAFKSTSTKAYLREIALVGAILQRQDEYKKF